MRSTRKQPFCWQEKKINRLLRKKYSGAERAKMLLLYTTITEIDSDFNSKRIKYYTKTISTYSGLSTKWIPQALKKLEKLKIIKIIIKRENGRLSNREITFTPDKVCEMGRKTIGSKPTNRKTTSRKIPPLEDSSSLEDSNLKEDINIYSKTKFCGHEINNIIQLFEPINPTYERFFKIIPQRKALERLVKKFGVIKVSNMVKVLPAIIEKPYAPRITTPLQLEAKLGDLILFHNQNNQNKINQYDEEGNLLN